MGFAIDKCPSCSATLAADTTRCPYCSAEVRFVAPPGAPAPAPADAAAAASPQPWVNEARAELTGGNRISAIKLVRLHTGMGLRDAKDFVERGALDNPAELAKLGPSVAGQQKASCFPAATRVATPDGWRAIGSLACGDRVWSWSAAGRSVQPITAIIRHACAPLWQLELAGRAPVETTGFHSFLTERGWLRADRLRPGDRLRGAGDAVVLATRATGTSAPVYNLHTAGPHNFIIDGAVAHNFTTLRALRTLFHRLFIDSHANPGPSTASGRPAGAATS